DDSLVGGLGIDTASYAGATAAVTANVSGLGRASGGAGTDSLSGIENLLGSSHKDGLTGNASANRLDGGSGNDTLIGGTGADNMLGGTGDDLFSVDNIADLTRESASGGLDTVQSSADFVLGANVENLRLLGAADIKGTGNSLANTLWAAAGNNILDGAGGIDTASYADSAAGVAASLTSRNASGGSGNDMLLNFENLVGSSHDDYLTGNSLVNMLDGGAGADTLKGGAGADTLAGGAGSDLYYVDDVGDLVVETGSNLAAGVDMVYTSVDYQLTANVENLRITSSADVDVTGNSKGNLIFSGTGSNVIDAGAGRDTLSYLYTGAAVKISLQAAGIAQVTGGSGTDTLYSIENLDGSNYGDTLDGNAASNVLNGGNGNDVLKGRGDTDWLDGGAGRDRLIGGTARDELKGGLGADIFEYNSIAETKPGGSRFEWDIIVDFSHDEGDRIDLYSIDADLALAGNQAFVFIEASGFTAAGQVLYDSSTGMLYGNVNADSDAEFAIYLL
ncbi:MAG: calcium-binding protein, partial [Pseudomonadota bacterium]